MHHISYLSEPASRYTWKPLRSAQLPSAGLENERPVDVVLYLRGVTKRRNETISALVRRLNPATFATQLISEPITAAPSVGGNTQNNRPVPVPVYGNEDARKLFTEFDDVIDLARYLRGGADDESRKERYTAAFGPQVTGHMSLNALIDMTLEFAQRYIAIRFRTLTTNITRDVTTDHDFRRSIGGRDLINMMVHEPVLEEDMLWTNASHIHQNLDMFQDTRPATVTYFQSWYRMTINEANTLVRFARERAQDGSRTEVGYRFGWIVNFINKFLSWRSQLLDYIGRSKGPAGNTWDPQGQHREANIGFHRGLWQQHGGTRIDAAFEYFLIAVFQVVATLQGGRPTSVSWTRVEAEVRGFCEVASLEMVTSSLRGRPGVVSQLQAAGFPGNFRTMDSRYSVPRPEIPFEWIPPVRPIPQNRTIPTLDGRYITQVIEKFQPRPAGPGADTDTDASRAGTRRIGRGHRPGARLAQTVRWNDEEDLLSSSEEDFEYDYDEAYRMADELRDYVSRLYELQFKGGLKRSGAAIATEDLEAPAAKKRQIIG
ncbi:hypothetical protein GGS23DRAFT_426096 [Durotheca rogersii]|uniref:uncharacterized protein n=1 Tax=Durotheca rogersii TaxID=419775 RepID=UPI00222082F6|nr:uncharacterized protein GGS23DRAFT_426096 [Durotheca rogersii]KAI5865415.1 hypothetical protein GGS23DRAFT_426096 [Durotheca rogersii]